MTTLPAPVNTGIQVASIPLPPRSCDIIATVYGHDKRKFELTLKPTDRLGIGDPLTALADLKQISQEYQNCSLVTYEYGGETFGPWIIRPEQVLYILP